MTFDPLIITKYSARHSGGTKDYHIVTARRDADNYGILITRYGKKSSWGHVDVKEFSSILSMVDEANDVRKKKEKRGYRTLETGSSHHTCETWEAFKIAIGAQYWSTLSKDIVAKLGGDASEVRAEPLTSDWERGEGGRLVKKDKALRGTEITKTPEPTIEARVQQNLNWGLW